MFTLLLKQYKKAATFLSPKKTTNHLEKQKQINMMLQYKNRNPKQHVT